MHQIVRNIDLANTSHSLKTQTIMKNVHFVSVLHIQNILLPGVLKQIKYIQL